MNLKYFVTAQHVFAHALGQISSFTEVLKELLTSCTERNKTHKLYEATF